MTDRETRIAQIQKLISALLDESFYYERLARNDMNSQVVLHTGKAKVNAAREAIVTALSEVMGELKASRDMARGMMDIAETRNGEIAKLTAERDEIGEALAVEREQRNHATEEYHAQLALADKFSAEVAGLRLELVAAKERLGSVELAAARYRIASERKFPKDERGYATTSPQWQEIIDAEAALLRAAKALVPALSTEREARTECAWCDKPIPAGRESAFCSEKCVSDSWEEAEREGT